MNSRASSPSSGRLQTRAFLTAVLLSVTLALPATSGCGGGGGSTPEVTAPISLVYPQTTIAATANQAIAVDPPSVAGTVTTFSVSPALPAGLSLDPTTGTISGTPTVVTAQATYTITASNASGSTTATVQIAVAAAVVAPTSLAYPQTSITATANQAITTDTPTVIGTATSFSVSPTLPVGLAISTTSGAISGTPTAATAQATYTITATNSAGSATATVNILVNAAVAPPSALTYPQTTINAFVGQAIPADIPVVTGTVTSFSVNPALPAGLSLSATTGAITGTSTAASPQATYTVAASNPGGSTTATLTIAVVVQSPTLFDVGHAGGIGQIHVSATNVLSQDATTTTAGLPTFHWVLWNYASNTEIASGDQPLPQCEILSIIGLPACHAVDMANQIFVIGQANGFEIHATSDGHLISAIQSPLIDPSNNEVISWWKLATDGSYVCAGTTTGLMVWSPTGQLLFTRPGNYYSTPGVTISANVYAAPGQILIASGPAGQNVIETVLATDGTSSVGPAFSGTFYSWFSDGQRFLTHTGTTVWVYSAGAVQQSILSLPTNTQLTGITQLAGQGNWFWTYQGIEGTLNIYAVGANTPSASYTIACCTTAVPSGSTIGLVSDGSPSVSVIDLSGSTPVKRDYPLPMASESAYGATSASQWIVGNQHGVLVDGASTSTTPRYFGSGQVWSMAGSTNLVAIATANGAISYYSPSSTSTTPVGTINFSSSKIALSSDGTILAAMANAYDYQYEPDRTLKIFSLPSGNLIYSSPFQFQSGNNVPFLFDFSLSGSGTVTGLFTETLYTGNPGTVARQTAPTLGGAVTWSDNGSGGGINPDGTQINLSPDGTHIAVAVGIQGPITLTGTHLSMTGSVLTNIYDKGILANTVTGFPIGWIDNNQLLVNNYSTTYSSASIYSATGALVSTPTLPELLTIQPINSSSLYSPGLNTIFALPSGNTLYSSTTPSNGQGAVVGSNVVFTSGSRILVDTR
jgi:hypothetical protein